MKKITIACDECGTDLTITSKEFASRVILSFENIPFYGLNDKPVSVIQVAKQEYHFCDLFCLKKSLDKQV